MKKLLFLYFLIFIGISQASNWKWIYNKDKTCSVYDTFEEKYKNIELFWTGKCSNGKAQGYGIAIITAKIDGKTKKIFRYEGKIVDGKYEDEALISYPDLDNKTIAFITFRNSKPIKAYWKFGQTYIKRTYDEKGNKTSEKKITDQDIIKKLKNWYKHTILKKYLPKCKAEEHILYAKKYFTKRDLPPIAYKRLMKCYNKHNTYPNKDSKYISLNEILFMASRFKLVEGVKVSLKNGANIQYRDNKGRTALIFAASSSNGKIIQLLLNSGADINVQDNKGYTALMEASKWRNLDALKTLLKYDADVNIKDFGKYKITALTWAIYNIADNDDEINRKIAKILILHGAKLSEEEQKFYDQKKYLEKCDKNRDGTNNKVDEMVCVVKILKEEVKKEKEELKKEKEEVKKEKEEVEMAKKILKMLEKL